MKLFEKLTIAALGVLLAGSAAGITTTTILDNKRIDDLQSQINDLNTRADELQEQIDNLKEQYNALKAQEEADIARVTADYQAKIDDLQRQIDEANAELKALDEKYEQAVADLKAKEEADIAALDAKYASEVQAIKDDYAAKIASLKNATEKQIADLKEEEDAAIKTLDLKYSTTLNALKQEYNSKLFDIQTKHNKDIAEVGTRIEELRNNCNTVINQMQLAINEIKAFYDSKLQDILDRLDDLENKDKDKLADGYYAIFDQSGELWYNMVGLDRLIRAKTTYSGVVDWVASEPQTFIDSYIPRGLCVYEVKNENGMMSIKLHTDDDSVEYAYIKPTTNANYTSGYDIFRTTADGRMVYLTDATYWNGSDNWANVSAYWYDWTNYIIEGKPFTFKKIDSSLFE